MGSAPPHRPQATEAAGQSAARRLGLALELVLTAYASVVFVALWVYVATAVLTDGQLLADTWEWLSGLDTVAAIVVWILILPVAVFVWAWQADLDPVWMAVVMVGLVLWTGAAWTGLIRALLRRSRPVV